MTADTPAVLYVSIDRSGLSPVPVASFHKHPGAEEWIPAPDPGQTFYIDCEFDGHNGPLLSIAMVREDGANAYVTTGAVAEDPWVIENVLPWLNSHDATNSWHVRPREVGTILRNFIWPCQNPVIVADSPVDIARFCQAISTSEHGGWASTDYPGMTFIVRNVDCYPTTLKGAIRHNAWWDAMALRAALAALPAPDEGAQEEGE